MAFTSGQTLTAAALNAAFSGCFPAGNVSAFSATMLAKTSSNAWLGALGLPTQAAGTPNGVATLDGSGKLPASQAPAGGMQAGTYDPQGIAADAFSRANHTGTQAISTVTGLSSALAGMQPLDSDLTALAGIATTGILARTGSGAAAARTITAGASGGVSVTNGDGSGGNPTVDVNIATAAQYRAATAGKMLDASVWSAAATVGLTDGSSVALDLSTGLNFTLTKGVNGTLANPTNAKVGQSGFIMITQGSGGSHTLAYSSNYVWAGGADGALSTTAGAIDVISYVVLASGKVLLSIFNGVA